MATTVIELTDEQKIQILEKAKELLGPNGEHWTKSCWWGVMRTDDEMIEYLYDIGEIGAKVLPPKAELDELDEVQEYEVKRRSLDVGHADKANVWCLMGALEESAYRLGIIAERSPSERLANPISLQNLVASKEDWAAISVIDVNDNPDTEWETIRDLIDERLSELHA